METAGTIKTTINLLYIILCTPWLLSHFFLDIVLYIFPWKRPIRNWSLNQAIRIRVVRLVLFYWSVARSGDKLNLHRGRERYRLEVVRPRYFQLYNGVLSDRYIEPKPLAMTWTPSQPPPAELVGGKMTVALHFHGGGFVIGNGRDSDTGYLSQTLIRHMGCTHVCTPQYRLASAKNGRFPAPLQDAVTSYLCLIREKGIPASQIIISGDSAGANIALGLLRYICDYGNEDELPSPGAVTLWSPWVDVNAALQQDLRMSPNYKTDYLNKEFGRWGAFSISGFGAISLASPYLSPLHHPFKLNRDIPLFIHAGEREVLCDDIKAFSQQYREVGWRVHLVVSEHCPHDIILLGPKIGFAREAEEAANRARRFLSSLASMELQGHEHIKLL